MTTTEMIKALLDKAARDQQTLLGKPRSVTSLVRRNLNLLTLLRREGEKWQDIAAALHGAGIRAPNGSAISSQVLSNTYKSETARVAFSTRRDQHQAGTVEHVQAEVAAPGVMEEPIAPASPPPHPPLPPPNPSDPDPLLNDVGEPGLTAAQRIALRRNRSPDQT